jgi:hypothetical protein
LLAAVLVVVMPSFIYTGMLMTENAFLPAVVRCFAIGVTLERRTLLRQAHNVQMLKHALAVLATLGLEPWRRR